MNGWREIADGVLVATSRREALSSIVVVGGGQALVIDPGWESDELETLTGALVGRGLEVIAGFATHAHHDHLLWHPGLGDVPRWASAGTAQAARQERGALQEALGAGFPAELAALMGRVRPTPRPERLPAEAVPDGCAVELLVHDAHAPGHTALWLPEQRVLIAGDMLSDVEIPLPYTAENLVPYREALERLAPWAEQAAWVIPGHGAPGRDGAARLAADTAYLEDVLAGREPHDARLEDPAMRRTHQELLAVL